MGSSSSKAARKAADVSAAASRRQYPTRKPTATTAPSARHDPLAQSAALTQETGSVVHPNVHSRQGQPQLNRNEDIFTDGQDPQFAKSLKSLGAVNPASTMSYTSTAASRQEPHVRERLYQTNPALIVVRARERFAAQAERELRAGVNAKDKTLADVGVIRQVLSMRDDMKMSGAEIERRLGLKAGAAAALASVKDAKMGGKDADDAGLYD